jgi:hypothetical protein
MFLLLGVLFLDHLLKLIRFLAQTREGLLSGIGFLSAFLSGAEIGFFRSPFSKRRQSQELCVVHAPPCLWRGRRVSRYELSGTVVSTRSLRTYFIAVRRFLVARSDGCFGSYLATYVLCSLERQKARTHVHRSPTFLVKVGLIPPRVRAR